MTSEWMNRMSSSSPSSSVPIVLRPPGQLYHLTSIPLPLSKSSKLKAAKELKERQKQQEEMERNKANFIASLATSYIANRLPKSLRSSKFLTKAPQPLSIPSTITSPIPFRVTFAPVCRCSVRLMPFRSVL
jgi:hypothetical protein